jgi:two-component system cell cycle response regulator
MLTHMARVLLIDDDLAILRLLEVNFRMEGFTVETASHGEEALALAAANTPDAVILDLMMPGMDGRQIFDRLRAEPATAGVPVVFLTARGRDDAVVGAGAIVVQKPFDTVELVATVRTMVETGHA